MKYRFVASVLALAMVIGAFAALTTPGRAGASATVIAPKTDLGWQAPAPLETQPIPENAWAGNVALSGDGTGWVVFSRDGFGVQSLIWGTRYHPAGGGAGGTNWEASVRISQGPNGAYGPQVAMDNSGNAIVVWYEWLVTKGYAIMASHYRSGGTWSAPVEIDQPSGYSYLPNIAMNAGGTAFVSWFVWDGTRYNQYANRYTPSGGWDTAVQLDATDYDAYYGRVGVDGTGNAIVTWEEWDGARYNVMAARFTTAVGWLAPVALEASAQTAVSPDIGMDTAGDGFVAWHQYDGVRWNVWVNRFVPATGWAGAVLIEAQAGTADGYRGPRVAAAAGTAIVTWDMIDATGTWSVWVNRFSGGAWSGEGMVDATSDNIAYAVIAMDPSGNAIISFADYVTVAGVQQENYRASRFSTTSGWTIGWWLDTSRQVPYVWGPLVAVDGAGNGLAVFTYDEDPTVDAVRPGLLANWYTASTNNWAPYWIDHPAEFDQELNQGWLVLHANDEGDAVLTWIQDDGPVWNAYAALYRPGVGWGPATRIENTDLGDVTEIWSGIDANGDVLAMYRIYDGTHYAIHGSYYAAGMGWFNDFPVDNLPYDCYWLRLAMSPSGDAMMTWQQWDGAGESIFSSFLDISLGTLFPPTLVEASGNYAWGSYVAIDGASDAMAVWTQWDGITYSDYSSISQNGGPWSPADLMEQSNSLSAGSTGT